MNLKAWFKFSILFKYLAIYLKSYYTEITQLNHALSLGQKTTPLFVIKILEFFWKVIKVIFPVKQKKVLNELVFVFGNTYCFLLYVSLIWGNFSKLLQKKLLPKNVCLFSFLRLLFFICSHGKYIFRLLHILPQSPFTTSKRKLDYYHKQANMRVASLFSEQFKALRTLRN